MPSSTPRTLSCYVRLWAASTLLRVYMATGRGDPLTTPLKCLTVSVALAALAPSRPQLVAVALFLRVALFFSVGGPLSNSQNWAMHLDLTLFLTLLPHCSKLAPMSPSAEAEAVATAGPASRLQLVIFYMASGFWKFNSSFVDYRYSCASICISQQVLEPCWSTHASFLRDPRSSVTDMVSLIGHRVTANASVLSLLARAAPAATIGFELLLPALQAAPTAGRWSRLGVAATLVFHLLIGVTPPPHNIGAWPWASTLPSALPLPLPLVPFDASRRSAVQQSTA